MFKQDSTEKEVLYIFVWLIGIILFYALVYALFWDNSAHHAVKLEKKANKQNIQIAKEIEPKQKIDLPDTQGDKKTTDSLSKHMDSKNNKTNNHTAEKREIKKSIEMHQNKSAALKNSSVLTKSKKTVLKPTKKTNISAPSKPNRAKFTQPVPKYHKNTQNSSWIYAAFFPHLKDSCSTKDKSKKISVAPQVPVVKKSTVSTPAVPPKPSIPQIPHIQNSTVEKNDIRDEAIRLLSK